jgi:hypothetical protein
MNSGINKVVKWGTLVILVFIWGLKKILKRNLDWSRLSNEGQSCEHGVKGGEG